MKKMTENVLLSSLQNSDFQRQLSESFIFFFIEEYHFRSTIFLKLQFFEALYFLKMCPIFVGSEVVGSSSYQKNICDEFTHLVRSYFFTNEETLGSWTLFSSKLDYPVIKTL